MNQQGSSDLDVEGYDPYTFPSDNDRMGCTAGHKVKPFHPDEGCPECKKLEREAFAAVHGLDPRPGDRRLCCFCFCEGDASNGCDGCMNDASVWF